MVLLQAPGARVRRVPEDPRLHREDATLVCRQGQGRGRREGGLNQVRIQERLINSAGPGYDSWKLETDMI